MAKGAYIGVDGIAKKIKKGYIGVDGVARRIKKAYIGIGGVARPCWSSGELVYYGTITSLSAARNNVSATTVGNYALFGGGNDSSKYFTTVDAYNTSLTRSTPTALSRGRTNIEATTVGNYALFGGGSDSSNYFTTVDAYNTSLTRSTPTALYTKRTSFCATTVGDYAVFAGGRNDSTTQVRIGSYYYNLPTSLTTVDAYNTSLTRSTPTALRTGRSDHAATTVGNYALFGGGYITDAKKANNSSNVYLVSTSTVDAYNTSLTRSTPTELSAARAYLAATTVGNYALFGGGFDSFGGGSDSFGGGYVSNEEVYPIVDAYDTSLTRSTPTELSAASQSLGAATVGNYALFGGGANLSEYLSTVTAYNASLTRSVPTGLSVARNICTSTTTVGNYALFGGGFSDEYHSAVDAYTIS